MATNANNQREIAHYFEYSHAGVEPEQDGLAELPFGEYLVETGALARNQLFEALMFQDKNPGVRIGQCAVVLGFVAYTDIDRLYSDYVSVALVEV